MLGKALLLLALASNLALAGDDLSIIREREATLAKALKARDKVALSAVTDSSFKFHFTHGCAVRSISIEMSREDWIDNLIHLHIDDYESVISDMRWLRARGPNANTKEPFAATARLKESWTLHSPGRIQTEKHFDSTDFWEKRQGTWKLTSRVSMPNPLSCGEGLNWGTPF